MEMQTVEKPQVLSPQHTSSMTKVEGAIGSTTQEVEVHKEAEIPEVQKEPEMTSGQSTMSVPGTDGASPPKPSAVHRVAATLPGQNKSSNMLLPSTLRLRLAPGPSTGEEEVETPSEHSMASGIPL
jgi:hypothetical protein